MSIMRIHQSSVFLCALSAVALIPGVGSAQTADPKAQEAALELYNRASQEMEEGDYGRACPRLEAARKILPDHVRTGMTLAQCYDEAGLPASAWIEFLRVKPLAKAQGKADKVAEIRSKLVDLAARMPKMRINVPPNITLLAGLAVTRNDVPVLPAQWDNDEPVDPGVYKISVTAVGKEPWTTRVEVKNEGKTIEVRLDPPWRVSADTNNAPVRKSQAKDVSDEPLSSLRPLGFVGMGLGAAGMIAGGVLGYLAISYNHNSKANCDDRDYCDLTGSSLRDQAITFGNGSTGLFVAGGVFLAGGGVLLALSTRKRKEKTPEKSPSKTALRVWPGGATILGVW